MEEAQQFDLHHFRHSKIVSDMPLVRSWQLSNALTFTIHLTKCIVTDPPLMASNRSNFANQHTSLLVPTNPTLTSTTRFPYFKQGGHVNDDWVTPTSSTAKRQDYKLDLRSGSDDWKKSSRWGGMEAGQGMVYPAQTVDGMVYIHGGKEYDEQLKRLRDRINRGKDTKISEGSTGDDLIPSAVECTTYGKLKSIGYDELIHVAPPVYNMNKNVDESGLELCYLNGFITAFNIHHELTSTGSRTKGQLLVILSPLIGAGCRNWPVSEAAKLAISAIENFCLLEIEHCKKNAHRNQVHLGLVGINKDVCEVVLDAAKEVFG